MSSHKTLAGLVKLSVGALVTAFTLVSCFGVAAAAPIPPCIHYSEVGGAAGTYYWNHVLNGRPLPKHFEVKDDNPHTIFGMSEGWVFGDVYKFQATHYSPATRKTYVAYNECVITRR
jgi:hypothetical protein